MPSRLVRFAALAACGIFAVAGCSGSDGDVAGPSGTVSPSPTPTATPTPTAEIPDVPVPRRPPDKHTSDGAIAFTKYVIAVINRAYLTGDTASMMTVASQDCGTCQHARGVIDAAYDAGHRLDGGQMTVTKTGGVALGEGVVPTVLTSVDISEMREIAADGGTARLTPAEKDVELMWDLEWKESWRLVEVREPSV